MGTREPDARSSDTSTVLVIDAPGRGPVRLGVITRELVARVAHASDKVGLQREQLAARVGIETRAREAAGQDHVEAGFGAAEWGGEARGKAVRDLPGIVHDRIYARRWRRGNSPKVRGG